MTSINRPVQLSVLGENKENTPFRAHPRQGTKGGLVASGMKTTRSLKHQSSAISATSLTKGTTVVGGLGVKLNGISTPLRKGVVGGGALMDVASSKKPALRDITNKVATPGGYPIAPKTGQKNPIGALVSQNPTKMSKLTSIAMDEMSSVKGDSRIPSQIKKSSASVKENHTNRIQPLVEADEDIQVEFVPESQPPLPEILGIDILDEEMKSILSQPHVSGNLPSLVHIPPLAQDLDFDLDTITDESFHFEDLLLDTLPGMKPFNYRDLLF